MIKTVFLDMDGVMVDFLGGLHRALDVPYDVRDYPYEKGKWNMLCDIRQGFEQIPSTFEQCNNACTSDFWANLEWMLDGNEIFQMVWEKFDPENIYLLTTCMPNPGSAPGKLRWLNKHISSFVPRAIILGSGVPKGSFAKPDTLLIDDKDENVEEFAAAGGYGILVNRLWNKGYERADHTVEDLEIDLLDIVHDVGVDQ